MDVRDAGDASRYAQWLAWTVRIGLVLLALAFVADLAGFMRQVPLESMPRIWSAPAPKHGGGVSSVVLVAIAWLASCSVVCLFPLLPLLRRHREPVMMWICIVQILIVALAAVGGTLLG